MTLESRSSTPVEKPICPLEGLEIRGLSGYKNGCGAERLSLPQPRVAHGFSWQSSPCAVGWHTQVSGLPQRSNSPSELPVPQQANRNQKHQVRVTHSALGLHAGHSPDRSEGRLAVQPGWLLGTRQMVTPAERNGVRATRWEPTGPRKREKALSMRAQAERPLSQRLHKGGCAYTVEAEKGGAMRQPQPSHAA